MPRTDDNGNLVFHPLELPKGFTPMETDPENSLLRKKQPLKKSIRKCKKCGAEFELLGEYDPENRAHDLCDDCLINLPLNQNQKYPEKSVQLLADDGVVFSSGDDD